MHLVTVFILTSQLVEPSINLVKSSLYNGRIDTEVRSSDAVPYEHTDMSPVSQDTRFIDTTTEAAMTQPTKKPTNNTSVLLLDGYPVTQFTPHILEILSHIDTQEQNIRKCPKYFLLKVSPPFPSIPTMWQSKKPKKADTDVWIDIINHTFNPTLHPERVLPFGGEGGGNETMVIGLGFKDADRNTPGKRNGPKYNWSCLANSSPNGTFAFINPLEAWRWSVQRELYPIPWEQRVSSVPIFRGAAWGSMDGLEQIVTDTRSAAAANVTSNVSTATSIITTNNNAALERFILERCTRCKAILYSKIHPSLLDAKFHASRGELFMEKNRRLLEQRASDSDIIHDILSIPFNKIDEISYYTKYQSTLVLCGIGAAFRLSLLLGTQTAVVLQDCEYHEWFTPYLVPWKHYIPLDNQLDNLNETMHWIQSHPIEVKQIARNGLNFYRRYLSFDKYEEHLYELLYRIAILKQREQWL